MLPQLPKEIDSKYYQYINVVEYEKNEQIFYTGDTIDKLYILIEGVLLIAPASEDGKLAILDYCNPGEMIGDIEYYCKDKVYQGVISSTKSVFLTIKYKYIDNIFSKINAFNLFMATTFATKLKIASRRQSVNMLYPFDQRLAKYIVDVCNFTNSKEISINSSTVAKYLGVTDRHYRRTISKFETQGMINKKGKKIIILDFNLLNNYGTF
jgi:CRP-like cAMP-binding protein